MGSKFQGSVAASAAADPCLAVDGLLELGEMILRALTRPRLEEGQRKGLRKRLSFTVSTLRQLAHLDYRTHEIEQLAARV
jgi:hypothetical protein